MNKFPSKEIIEDVTPDTYILRQNRSPYPDR